MKAANEPNLMTYDEYLKAQPDISIEIPLSVDFMLTHTSPGEAEDQILVMVYNEIKKKAGSVSPDAFESLTLGKSSSAMGVSFVVRVYKNRVAFPGRDMWWSDLVDKITQINLDRLADPVRD